MAAVAATVRTRAVRFSEMAAVQRAKAAPYPTCILCRNASHAVLPKAVRAAAVAADDAGNGDGIPSLRS